MAETIAAWFDGAFVATVAIAAGGAFALAMLLTFSVRAGQGGRAIADVCARAPFLDIVVGLFTWIPWVAGAAVLGWRGVPAVLLGQVVALCGWVVVHELMHRRHVRGPRIVKVLNKSVGRFRNHLALWLTLPALPVFLSIRIAQVVFYPALVLVVGLPGYKQREWVNVSRQKFEGLVGHDLIWCLYCDWMTGVYSLGGEMLRNVESFWCPIRFYDGKKCENCRIDFPDIDGGWTPADKGMADVVATMEKMQGGGNHSWFGHPTRLTVKGVGVGNAAGSAGGPTTQATATTGGCGTCPSKES